MNQELLNSIEEISIQLENAKLLEFLNVDEFFLIMVDNINSETQIPKVFIRLLMKVLISSSKKGFSKLSKHIQLKILKILSTSPKFISLIKLINAELIIKLEDNLILEYVNHNSTKPVTTKNATPINQILYRLFERENDIISSINESTQNIMSSIKEQGLIHNPNLEIKNITSTKGFDKLKYISSFISFSGREFDIQYLNNFINNDKKFSWTVIYGDAGEGKSRLALEYCKILPSYWEKGFLSIDSFHECNNWNPLIDTFIIIDNSSKNIDKIRIFLNTMASKSTLLNVKVKVLLMDRTLSEPNNWYKDELLMGDTNNIVDYQYKEPYKLENLSKKPLLNIIKTFYYTTKSDKKILKEFEKFDKKKRPLFAAIFALTLSKNHEDKDLTIHNFLHTLYEWKQNLIDEKHLRIILLTTICRNIDINTLDNVLFPDIEEIDEGILSNFIDIKNDIYTGIEPDIIGEIFFLEFLKVDSIFLSRKGSGRSKLKRIEVFIDFCWKEYGNDMFLMALRCFQDFPQHESLDLIWNVQKIQSRDSACSLYFNLTSNIVNILKNNNLEEKAQTIMNELEKSFELKDNFNITSAYSNIFTNILNKYTLYQDGEKYFKQVLQRCLKIKEISLTSLMDILIAFIDFAIKNLRYKEASFAMAYLNRFPAKSINAIDYNRLCACYDKLLLTGKNNFITLGITSIVFEKLYNISLIYDTEYIYDIFYKWVSNYLVHLIHFEKNMEEAIFISKFTLSKINELDIASLYKYLAMNSFTVIPIFDNQLVGHYTCSCILNLYYEKSNKDHVLLIIFFNWFENYISVYPERILHQDKMSYYKNIKGIPMSAENVLIIQSLLTDERNHLYDIVKTECSGYIFEEDGIIAISFKQEYD